MHFFHRELEAYITVEGVFGEEIAEDGRCNNFTQSLLVAISQLCVSDC